MIAIVDYGVGNLFSLSSSLKALGLETEIEFVSILVIETVFAKIDSFGIAFEYKGGIVVLYLPYIHCLMT